MWKKKKKKKIERTQERVGTTQYRASPARPPHRCSGSPVSPASAPPRFIIGRCAPPPPCACVVGTDAPRVRTEAPPAGAVLVPRHPPAQLVDADLFRAGAPTVAAVGGRLPDHVAQGVYVAVRRRVIIHRLNVHATYNWESSKGRNKEEAPQRESNTDGRADECQMTQRREKKGQWAP